MIAKLRIRKWVRNFLWEHCVGLPSHSVDSVPANTSPFHLSAFCFLLEAGIPGSGRDQHCFICRTCAPTMVSAHLGPQALEMLLVVPANWAVAGCAAGNTVTWGQALASPQRQLPPVASLPCSLLILYFWDYFPPPTPSLPGLPPPFT